MDRNEDSKHIPLDFYLNYGETDRSMGDRNFESKDFSSGGKYTFEGNLGSITPSLNYSSGKSKFSFKDGFVIDQEGKQIGYSLDGELLLNKEGTARLRAGIGRDETKSKVQGTYKGTPVFQEKMNDQITKFRFGGGYKDFDADVEATDEGDFSGRAIYRLDESGDISLQGVVDREGNVRSQANLRLRFSEGGFVSTTLTKEEFDPNTITLKQAAELYSTEKGLKNKIGRFGDQGSFKEYGDMTVAEAFTPGEDGVTPVQKMLGTVEKDSAKKSSMQAFRYIGSYVKDRTPKNSPLREILPDEKLTDQQTKDFFGSTEPAKAKSEVQVTANKKKLGAWFKGLNEYAEKNPEMKPAVQAIIFNANTGLRPSAVTGLTSNMYYGESGAIYVPAEVKGAKGRSVNIPLNPVADSILQDRLANLPEGQTKLFNVSNDDMNKVLSAVKVKDLVYDAGSGKFFDSFNPEGFAGKKGAQLMRNLHATLGTSIGIEGERLAYLQGRSLKSAMKGSTGELSTYIGAFPGEISEFDREQASKISAFWSEVAGQDVIKTYAPIPERRITESTPGYEDYFTRETDVEPQARVETAPSKPEDAQRKRVDNLKEKMFGGLFSKTIKAVPIIGGAVGVAEEAMAGNIEGVAREALMGFTPLGALEADSVAPGTLQPEQESFLDDYDATELPGREDVLGKAEGGPIDLDRIKRYQPIGDHIDLDRIKRYQPINIIPEFPQRKPKDRPPFEMEQLGDVEYRVDLDPALARNPLARLGYATEIFELLPEREEGEIQGFHKYQIVDGEVVQDKMQVTPKASGNPDIQGHEFTHRAIQLMFNEAFGGSTEDVQRFERAYGMEAAGLLNQIANVSGSRSANEFLVELFDPEEGFHTDLSNKKVDKAYKKGIGNLIRFANDILAESGEPQAKKDRKRLIEMNPEDIFDEYTFNTREYNLIDRTLQKVDSFLSGR